MSPVGPFSNSFGLAGTQLLHDYLSTCLAQSAEGRTRDVDVTG